MPTLEMNHAMIYTRDVAKSLAFYQHALGFELLETYQTPHGPVYARLLIPASKSTIALHALQPAEPLVPGAIRLYFEIKSLESFCKKLEKKGVTLKKPPALMPWGWRHAYLDDPDGHEISLYWAGAKRLKKAKPAG
jgi:catechol 2,3-dioxygenase-like lactoylglutathione lyase family enzyme